MSLGQNLQFLRKIKNEMTQEELAQRLDVSRQTVSKWELDTAYPEIGKIIELCELFSCSMDELVRGDMNIIDEAYSNIRMEEVGAFRYIQYTVVSAEPESDAIEHVRRRAAQAHIADPEIIGWDFPAVSQDQINVYHLHGYTAALVLKGESPEISENPQVLCQEKQKYMAITIRFSAGMDPFQVIPNGYKILMAYMKTNGARQKRDKKIIPCFEKEYCIDGTDYMDVYIAVE